MATIVTRAGKGSALTHNEVDANFNNLNSAKVETSTISSFGATLVDDADAGAARTTLGLGTTDSPTFAALTSTGEITANGGIALGDNDKATFGAGDDLQIYHDGSDSWISDAAGVGNLYIRSNDLIVMNAPNNETLLRTSQDGAVTAYHNGSAKLATTSTGIDVTGSGTFNTTGDSNSSKGIVINTSGTNFESDAGIIQVTHAGSGSNTGGYFMKLKHNGSEKFTIKGNGDVTATGDVGIGTTSPENKLHIFSGESGGAGSIGLVTIEDDTHAYLQFLTPSSKEQGVLFGDSDNNVGGITYSHVTDALMFTANAAERMRIDSSGNVGIGATPATGVRLDIRSNAAANIADLRNASATGFGLYVAAGDTSSHYALRAADYQNNTLFTVQSAGNVGIGTTSPENPVTIQDIGGSTFNRDFAIRNGDATNYHRLVLGYNAASAASGVPTNAQFILAEKGGGYGTNAGLVVGNSDNAPVMFTTNGTEKMRIMNTGAVGIGTTTLNSNKMVIEGGTAAANGSSLAIKTGGGANSRVADLAFYGTFVSPSSDNGQRRTADITSGFSTANWGNEYLAFHAGYGSSNDAANVTAERMRITGAGNVQVGSGQSVTGGRYFDVYNLGSTATDFSIIRLITQQVGNTSSTTAQMFKRKNGEFRITNDDTNSAAYTAFNVGASERLRITGAGAVGIGTTAPVAKLGIVGGTSNASNLSTAYSLAAFNITPKSTSGYSLAFGSGPGDLPYLQMSAGGSASGNLLIQPYGGNVGIGTTSPQKTLDVKGTFAISNSTTSYWDFDRDDSDGSLKIADTGTERMRIDSAGSVLVAKTATGEVLTQGVELNISGGVYATTAVAGERSYFVNKATSGTRYLISFYANTSSVGSITSDGSSTTYATSSDYRLKENVVYDWDATTRLKQLKPARFNFIADADKTVDGFLAHEAQAIVPEAITGTKDAMTTEVLYVEDDELPDGKSIGDVKEASVPDMQGIDQSKLVPLLVKTIQELEARLTALEG